MPKVLIVTEGQTELIFVRNLLRNTIDNSKLSFECVELHNSEQMVPYSHKNPNAEFHFLIVNVGNDETVMTTIKEREQHYFDKGGFDKIIGIRDMYCGLYRKRSRVICDEVTKQFIDGHNEIVQGMTNHERIAICFCIMEVEAWFISMYTLLQKADPSLTAEHIESRLHFNPQNIDPQKEFYHPSDELRKILELSGRTYKKSKGEVEMVTSRVDIHDVEAGTENGRCGSLRQFLDEIGLQSATN